MHAQPRPPASADSMAERPDIGSREDIIALLEDFYAKAFADDLLGPVFVDVAQMDLAAHLPRLADFWETTLLRSGGYRGNALEPHRTLHAKAPLTAEHFERWMQLWTLALEARFAGPVAERAAVQADRISVAMRKRLDIADDSSPWGPTPEGRPELPVHTLPVRDA